MINLAHYIQCHPSFRYLRVRHKKTVIVVFIVFLVFFLTKDVVHSGIGGGDISIKRSHDGDEVLFLKSQLGYLKSKLARVGKPVDSNDLSKPTIYVITPTYKRPVQKAELVRLCQTFLMVPNLHWILVEDSKEKTPLVTNFLKTCGVAYTHLSVVTPQQMKLKEDDPSWIKPKGVLQRNEGLDWLRKNRMSGSGVIYFADDDNTYSLELFEEMRDTKKVSVWPVGLVGGMMVEKPHIDPKTKKVVSWDVGWHPNRPFAIDMAGFATNLQLFLDKPKTRFSYRVKRGMQESEFLAHLVTKDELEPKASECTRVLVWHTRTEQVKLDMEDKRRERLLPPSNINMEV